MSAESFTYDSANPLDLVDGESPRANAALTDYALLGPARSLAQLYTAYQKRPKSGPNKPPTRQVSQLKEWSAAHRWVERVATYDQQQREAQRTAVEAQWKERALAERERTWQIAQELQARALEMLKFPLAEMVREVDRQDVDEHTTIVNQTTIKPVRWGLRDAAIIAEIASKLARLSAELETDRIAIHEYTPKDLQNMSREQLLALKTQIEQRKSGR